MAYLKPHPGLDEDLRRIGDHAEAGWIELCTWDWSERPMCEGFTVDDLLMGLWLPNTGKDGLRCGILFRLIELQRVEVGLALHAFEADFDHYAEQATDLGIPAEAVKTATFRYTTWVRQLVDERPNDV
ncbi:hypothetical protein [Actinoplanes aureus]|uniref:Uncharacterized protein n=1 Tax=Actinoplanes aureus TaxID=2792083 RepID=A0A931CAK7_9ACTN|nr:hypothetical protein [Actinoplanes aureus]MBG0562593.1 hypothetical protein [Actinoplanes aureus]